MDYCMMVGMPYSQLGFELDDDGVMEDFDKILPKFRIGVIRGLASVTTTSGSNAWQYMNSLNLSEQEFDDFLCETIAKCVELLVPENTAFLPQTFGEYFILLADADESSAPTETYTLFGMLQHLEVVSC